MTFQDIINYWLQHPPVEVTDMTAYQELLQMAIQQTVHELSEIYPIVDETIFDTGYAVTLLPKIRLNNTNNISEKMMTAATEDIQTTNMTLFDIKGIDANIMRIIVLYDTNNPPTLINNLSIKYQLSKLFADNTNHRTVFSLMDIIGYRNEIDQIREWFSKQIDKIKYKGNKLKLKPLTRYYALYERYRQLDELPEDLLKPFEDMLASNLIIRFYNSDVFSGESEIRSVSISGLSVTFNVPSADSKQSLIMKLQEHKNKIIEELSLDYEDEIGLI